MPSSNKQLQLARGGQPVCSQIDNRALLHRRRLASRTARWPRLSNLALSAICRLCSFKQLALKQRFHRHEVYLPPSVCSLHVAFPISRPTFEDSFRSKASWYSTSLAIKFSFIIIIYRTRSLARAEKELFSRDIGILRGQIKTTLWLSDTAAAAGMNSGTKGAVYE